MSLNSVLTEPTLCGFGPHDVSAATDPMTTSTAAIPAPHFIFDLLNHSLTALRH
jgi:hypothetical protein